MEFLKSLYEIQKDVTYKNIFKKSLSNIVKKTFIDFLNPKLLRFIDLTDIDLSMF